MTTITMNNEKNGIEIRFESKPSADVLTGLKANGFRWSGKQKMWYAVRNAAREAFANTIGGEVVSSGSNNNNEKAEHKEYDLWALTRTSEIGDNFAKYRIYDCKEIAAIIRKHLRERFPFCKWSVTSDIHSISVKLKCSPFAKDSDETQAIANYAYRFADSYNYDNSDSMTDYFDVNFYGVYGVSSILDWDYVQREMTVSEMNMSARFAESKETWAKAEAERLEREIEERRRQDEADRIEAARIRAEEEKMVAEIEADATVDEYVDLYVVNALEPDRSKACRVSEYRADDVKFTRVKCQISKSVILSRECFDNFCNLLLHDFSFLSKMGGSRTDDLRINSDLDYQNMTREERETVEWYSCNCVMVMTEGEMIIVDPQGYDYARYVFLMDEESKIKREVEKNTGISEEEAQKYSELADDLEDVSAQIIQDNDLIGTWECENFDQYKAAMIDWVERNKFQLNKNVARAIKLESLKVAVYRILTEYESLQSQFARAGMEYDQKFTMIRINDFGGVSTTRGKFRSVINTNYAQYKDAVKLVLLPEKKRQEHYIYLHGGVLIYDGYVDFPEDLLFTIGEKTIGEHKVVTKMSKYGSCDHRQITDVLEYFGKQNIKPIVNTYQPEF